MAQKDRQCVAQSSSKWLNRSAKVQLRVAQCGSEGPPVCGLRVDTQQSVAQKALSVSTGVENEHIFARQVAQW